MSVWKVREHRVRVRIWQVRGCSEGTGERLRDERTYREGTGEGLAGERT